MNVSCNPRIQRIQRLHIGSARIRHGQEIVCDVLTNRKIVKRSQLEGGVAIVCVIHFES